MSRTRCNYKIILLVISVALLAGFDIYYFFVRRGVTPGYYFHKLLQEPKDEILKLSSYRDLSEEYFIFNKKYEGKPVNVFVGDSITKRFNLSEFHQYANTINRGISSDTTFGLLQRIEDNLNNLHIDKLFIMIGYNDLEYRDNQEIIGNISGILSKNSANKIYLQSILPVSSDMEEKNKRIVELNRQLRKIASEKGHIYVDLHSRFLDNNGGMDSRLTRDGVHPNFHGYQLWYSIIEPSIRE